MIILEADYEKICCCLLKGRAAHTSRQLESFETASVYFLAISRKWKSPFHINTKNRFRKAVKKWSNVQILRFPMSSPVPAVLMTLMIKTETIQIRLAHHHMVLAWHLV